MIEVDYEYEVERAESIAERASARGAVAERGAMMRIRRGKAQSSKRALRIAKAEIGITSCEVCEWSSSVADLLHAHHIVPLECGGGDEQTNLALLCPNCHAVAHALWRTYRDGSGARSCDAPKEHGEFINVLAIKVLPNSATFSATSREKRREVKRAK